MLEEAAEQAHGLEHGELLGKLRLLQLNAEPLPEFRRVPIPAHAEHLDLARIGGRQAFADFDGGGFAGAVGPEQAEAFAAAHFQIEAVDGHHVFVGLAQIVEAKCGRR